MKAIEFIKKFGWIDASHKNVWFHFGCSSERSFESIHGFRIIEDLKPYIDAWVLVQKHGGLDGARKVSHKNCFNRDVNILKAISLVEEVGECNE